MHEYIEVIVNSGWVELRLNRPSKLNALRVEMCEELAAAAEQYARQPDVKCIVISGEGDHFCAGFDVASEMPATDPKSVWVTNRSMQAAFARINDLPVVTICAMRGYVVGAGFLLAAVCNLRYATPDAIFYIPELDMGIPFSLGGVATIARYIGITRTAEMVLTCNKVPATSDYMNDFVTQRIPAAELDDFVARTADAIARRPNSLILSSLSTLREAERALMPNPASDLFTMLYVDQEQEAKGVRVNYSRRFKS